MSYLKIVFIAAMFVILWDLTVIADEIKFEKKIGKKFQPVTLTDVIIIEETHTCYRYLVFNKEYQSPEPRLANKTEGSEEQNAVGTRASAEVRKTILTKWKKQSISAIVTLTEGKTENVHCISIKYPLSSSAAKSEAAWHWQKPAILLRDGSELKFSAVEKIQFETKTAVANVKFRNGELKTLQYVIKRKIYNGNLPGVLIGITANYTYYRMPLDKIYSLEIVK